MKENSVQELNVAVRGGVCRLILNPMGLDLSEIEKQTLRREIRKGLRECVCLFHSRYAQPVDLEFDSVDPAAERVQQLVKNQEILHRFSVDEGLRPVLDRLLELT
jgi:hypothetical protein